MNQKNEHIPLITREELLQTNKRIGNNKAPGMDNIPNVDHPSLPGVIRLPIEGSYPSEDILLSSFHLNVDRLVDFPVPFSTIHRTLTALRCFGTDVCYLPSLESTIDLSRSSLEVRFFGQTVCLNVYCSATTGCGSLGFSVVYFATAIAANET